MQIYRKFSIYANFLMQVLSDQQINDISSAWKADFAPDLSDERKKCVGGRFCSWSDTSGNQECATEGGVESRESGAGAELGA